MKILPCLTFPPDIDESVLETDASKEFWGAVLKIKGRKLEKIY